MKHLNIFRLGGALLFFICSSCNSWLDVKPDNKVLENDLLNSETGFQTALNGIYLGMADEDLYGRELSCGYIEAMAQMYSIEQQATGNSNRYLFFTQYKYTDSSVKGYLERTWTDFYKLIANCNNLMEQAELRKDVFASEADYNDYLSELYALRAFLHFDVFRMWGPIYSESTKDVKCIPYNLKRLPMPESLSTAREVVDYVLADLKTADSLAGSNAAAYKMKIGKYAVKALRARVYLYIGEKELAYEEVNALFASNIHVAYPFVEAADVQNSTSPDRLFYSEQIFILENSKRDKLYEDLFDYMLTNEAYLAPRLEDVSKLYANRSDYRYGWWSLNPGNGKEVAFVKYAKISYNNNEILKRAQSLLKVSELYLIMAECAPDEDVRIKYLDRLRVGRGFQEGMVSESERNDWETTLRDEYKREFYGEGQYFFFLKRKNISSLVSGNGKGNLSMGPATYVIPLPESESLYR